MAYPDVVLHHLITSNNGPGQEFEGYLGKLDLDKVEPEPWSDLLKTLHEGTNLALSLEGFRRRRRWLLVIGGLLALTTLAVRWQRTVPHTHISRRGP